MKLHNKKKVSFLISGGGSNLLKILKNNSINRDFDVVTILSNNKISSNIKSCVKKFFKNVFVMEFQTKLQKKNFFDTNTIFSIGYMKVIEKSIIQNFDIIINATSLGLKDGEDFNFDFSSTKNDLIYIDTIYNPLETKTFRFLKQEGKKVFNGLDMFIYQGQKSFYLWNKINPEIDNGLIELLNSKLKK